MQAASILAMQYVILFFIVKVSSSTMVVYVDPDPSSYVFGDSQTNEEYLIPKFKRSAYLHIVTDEKKQEEVCHLKKIHAHTPHHGHLLNGSRVEIQQDNEYQFVATFVECLHNDRPSCHGIDTRRFSSECITQFEERAARVRLANTNGAFVNAVVKVPIACQCLLRRVPTIFE